MLIEGTIIGFIVGKIRGGKLSNLGLLSINAWAVMMVAFILQAVLIFSNKIAFLAQHGAIFYIISLILLIFCLMRNLDKKGFLIILIGLTLNLLVIIINGGKMPVDFGKMVLAGTQMKYYIPLSEAKSFTKFLGKTIFIPKPYPLSKVMSAGDLLISLGMMLFIQGEMIRNRFGKRASRMIQFQYKGK